MEGHAQSPAEHACSRRERGCKKRGQFMSLLEAHHISKAFGGIRALDGCSITVEQGSITGLIGPNGSGKTTLFNVMTGYERADSGEISFNGMSITRSRPDAIFEFGMGRTFQLTRIFPRLTVLENMH